MWIMAKNGKITNPREEMVLVLDTIGLLVTCFLFIILFLILIVSGDGSNKEGSLLASQMNNYLCCGVVCSVLAIAQILQLLWETVMACGLARVIK